jgi:hypothetical protein
MFVKVEASSSKKDEVERPKVTFEEYMDSKEREQRDLTEETINPQIPVG